MEIHDDIVAVAAAERGVPKINHADGDEKATDNGAGKLLGSGGHSYDQDGKDIGGVQGIAKNVSKPDDREYRHHAEGSNEVVGQHHHHERHNGGHDDERIHERAGIGKARMSEHIDP